MAGSGNFVAILSKDQQRRMPAVCNRSAGVLVFTSLFPSLLSLEDFHGLRGAPAYPSLSPDSL